MTGKEKCAQLKKYRNKVAEANGIDFTAKECDFQGECPGFCPACDEEILFLEKELRKRERQGFDIKLQGLINIAFKNGDTVHEYTPAPHSDRGMLGRIVCRDPEEKKNDDDMRFEEAIKKMINFTSDNDNNDVETNENSPIEEPQEGDLMGDIAFPDEYFNWLDGFSDNESNEDTDTLMGVIDQDYLDELFADDDDDEDYDDDDENVDDDSDDDGGGGTTFLGWIEDPNGDW